MCPDVDEGWPPALLPSEITTFVRRLAAMGWEASDDAMMMASDLLPAKSRASAMLDGMKTGMQQAMEADAGRRVVAVWFDDWSARATFSWNGPASPALQGAITNAINSALKPDGETDADSR